MGTTQSDISRIGTTKGQGHRILTVRANSPLEKVVDPYFDFIIDPQRSTKQILGRLTESDPRRERRFPRTLEEIFRENQNSVVTLKIVSTKYRNVRTVEFTPNQNWNGKLDLAGIQTRLQRYDQAFQTYFPFSQIRPNSPTKKSNIHPGEYLIGCQQFKYVSISQLLQNLYQRYFDKTIENKTVHLAVYNLLLDELRVVPVLLSRSWGDRGEKGLLGCQFLEGHLNRFPRNLEESRELLRMRKKCSDDGVKIKKELSQCNGASLQLIQSLKHQKNRKKNIKHLKNILLIQPSKHPNPPQRVPQQIPSPVLPGPPPKKQPQPQIPPNPNPNPNPQSQSQPEPQFVPLHKFKQLENRVATLEEMLSNVRRYVEEIQDDSGEES